MEKTEFDNNIQEVVSLFVENLPETLHWKGLWFSFARHGDVVNAYIARKRCRGGKRFGFVRMKNPEEAEARNYYGWERKAAGRAQFTNKSSMDFGDGFSKGHGEGGAATGSMLAKNGTPEEAMVKVEQKKKKITGHVEIEDLWQLRRCLVGVMDTICSASNIHNILAKWGLGEINVQRLAAKTFLLTIEDEELYLMLEVVNWTYLNEIFQEAKPWSEKLAGLWGTFESLGENDKHTLDCEKVRVLIATNQVKQMEETIDVEIGDSVFQVSVREVGFHDGTSYPLCNNGNSEMADSEKIDESTSTSKSDMVRSKSENEVDWNRPGMEEEEIQARWVERNCINGDSWDNETSRGHIKFSELVGGLPKDTGALDGVGIGEGCGLEARPCENFDPLSGLASYGKGRIAESNSVVNLDLDPKEHAGGVANGQKKPWAERINEKVNLGYIHGRYPIEDDILEDESDRGKGTKEEG
ncbi:hypothetical protein V6N13_037991 [Hibiscus sabdariffa]